MDNEEISSIPSTPASATSGAPLFGSLRSEKNGNRSDGRKKSLLKNINCFAIEECNLEDGSLPRVSCALPLPPAPIPLAKKVGAEFIGTFILMLAGMGTAIENQKVENSETLIGCAGASGLVVMIIILSTSHISAAHLNSVVTISFAALKHFPRKNVHVYIGAQILASICAAFSLKVIFHPFMNGGVTVPLIAIGEAFALEFIIGFNLMFVVTVVATDTRAMGEFAGIAVGATVMLNIQSGSMNPVRTLDPTIVANNFRGIWLYLIAPIFGALIGAGAYTAAKLPDQEFNPELKASSAPGNFRR